MNDSSNSGSWPLPALVVHADWSGRPVGRIMMVAELRHGRYQLHPTQPVPPLDQWLTWLKQRLPNQQGPILIGVDFPIGLPKGYADLAGIDDFLSWLPKTAVPPWSQFYEVAERPEEIGVRRPFYPKRPGGTRQKQLLDGLGVNSIEDLRRQCEFATLSRRAASPLFWTIGAQQVGKATIAGWQEFILPNLDHLSLWPFSGELSDLFARPGTVVLTETYPGEVYGWLDINFGRGGKGSKEARQANGARLIVIADAMNIVLLAEAEAEIMAGFETDDAFDACVGVLGMLQVVLGKRPLYEPTDPTIKRLEGWIFGQDA